MKVDRIRMMPRQSGGDKSRPSAMIASCSGTILTVPLLSTSSVGSRKYAFVVNDDEGHRFYATATTGAAAMTAAFLLLGALTATDAKAGIRDFGRTR